MASLDLLRLELLGRFRLLASGTALAVPPTSQRLLAYLAIHGSAARERAAGILWAHSGRRAAGASLRSALWRLPSSVRLALIETTTGGRIALHRDVDVDFDCARRQLVSMLEGEHGATASTQDLTDDLLPDWYDDWLVLPRERYRQLRLHALESLARELTQRRRFGDAVNAALLAVEGEPLRESAHRCLIEIHLAEGNAAEAQRHLASYVEILREARLPTDVSPAMRALFDASEPLPR